MDRWKGSMSKIEDQVIERIQQRVERGLKKYNTDMERVDLTLIEWLQHAQDEMLDGAIYLERLKEEFQTKLDEAVKIITEEIQAANGG